MSNNIAAHDEASATDTAVGGGLATDASAAEPATKGADKKGKAAKDDSKAKATLAASAPPPSATATKLLVRNLAFEATKRDLQELFGAFGQGA
jgi:multiple RNA-binding domain-containing protein 1